MITIFLPNGFGDLLMAIPAITRLIEFCGIREIRIVVHGSLHKEMLSDIYGEYLEVLMRYDGRKFSQLRLWFNILLGPRGVILAPLLSAKMVNIIFFASLFHRVFVPNIFNLKKILRINNVGIKISNFMAHQVDYYVDFFSRVLPGLNTLPVNGKELNLLRCKPESKERKSRIRKKIAVALSCGISERHKVPSPVIFSKIITKLAEHCAIDVLVFGTAADIELISEFQLGVISKDVNICVASDMPIIDLIQLLGTCDAGVTGTTGQGHMMAAAGIPLVVLSGVTNPYESGPFSERVVVLRHNFECGPCYQEDFRFGCQLFKCMNEIDVKIAASLIAKIISEHDFGSNWNSISNRPLTVHSSTAMAAAKKNFLKINYQK